MSTYKHCPPPSGLHAKLRNELSAASDYTIRLRNGAPPNHIVIVTHKPHFRAVWCGHRDLMPSAYRGAQDPCGLLSRPASD